MDVRYPRGPKMKQVITLQGSNLNATLLSEKEAGELKAVVERIEDGIRDETQSLQRQGAHAAYEPQRSVVQADSFYPTARAPALPSSGETSCTSTV